WRWWLFCTPTPAAGLWSTPTLPTGLWSAPRTAKPLWSARPWSTTTTAGVWVSPPTPTSGLRYPPCTAAGLRSPPSTTAGVWSSATEVWGTPSSTAALRSPPSAAGGYGAQQGYGAPPPQQGYHQGYQGGPPPGVDPTLWGWFQTVDQDRSGSINATELRQALVNGNWSHFNPETCRLLIGMFDQNKDGTINIQEFAALWKYINDWKGCFDRFDTDRSGNIDAQELNNAFRTFGYSLVYSERAPGSQKVGPSGADRSSQGSRNVGIDVASFCGMIVTKFDRSSNRTINFDDFIQVCVMLKALTDKFQQKDVHRRGVIRINYEEVTLSKWGTGSFAQKSGFSGSGERAEAVSAGGHASRGTLSPEPPLPSRHPGRGSPRSHAGSKGSPCRLGGGGTLAWRPTFVPEKATGGSNSRLVFPGTRATYQTRPQPQLV
ncbi:Pho85/PhoA-like cyclin-dependent kinase pef1, partial [Branchiostoma belcheri]